MASFGLSSSSVAAGGASPPPPQQQEAIEASTPWMAAADGKLSLLEAALQTLHLPITAADENGYTLLQAAASYGQIPVMQFILQSMHNNCVHVNAVDNEGDSALHYAGTVEAAQILIQVGRIDPNLQNKQGKTALQHKQEELRTLLEDDEEDSDSEDVESLKKQVEYLKSVINVPCA